MSGMMITGQTIEGKAAADWPKLYKLCEQYHRFGIEVFDLDTREISDQQRKWLHCDNGPIHRLMAEGWSFKDAKNHLKRAYGKHLFIKYITGKNFKTATGEVWWECQVAFCNTLIHPVNIGYKNGKRCCPLCGSHKIKLIAMKSIMDLSVKKTNQWFDAIFDAMPNLPKPDPDWKENKNKENKNE